ncbi:transposase [Pseudomonas stutzeri]|uniref:Transposase n=1 Tax=Stutzerimonas stutzeri TaxID=316 RepID=A0A2N8T119_STUST|nr:transposase [Stutzerimonas stutzeri]MCQ4252141.1 transposase [Stutzerimonas stutzeri]PNG08437.1 transposase [Stutzerimonas stutzeri]
MSTDAYFSSRRLRAGRWSSEGQIYLVTAVTKERKAVFRDFKAARILVGVLRDDAARGSHLTLAFVVMPDHVHWLLALQQASLSQLVGRVKSISAKRIGCPVWQDGFHDRALRKEEDVRATARYVVANPLRAGLVERIGDYPHWDAVWL